MRDLSTSSATKVVQEDTHKNVNEKTILCNIQGHFNP
jgi:S-adenosylhomocysteine hydrolase